MRKYLFGILAISLAVLITSFVARNETAPVKKNKTTSARNDEPAPNACVWFQFIGDATNSQSVTNSNNWLEYTGNVTTLCNNVNVRVCAICVKTSNVTGTAPNRRISSFSNIYFNYTGPGGTWYAFMPGPSDLEAFRNRN